MNQGAAADREPALVGELRRTLARLELALAQISDGLVITDSAGAILWCNGGFERLIAQPRLQLMGRSLPILLRQMLVAEARLPLEQLLQEQPEGGIVTAMASRDPLQVLELEWRPVLTESSIPYIFRLHDISDRASLAQLQQRSEELIHQQIRLAEEVVTCPVTGLPNRRGLLQAIGRVLETTRESSSWLAVLFCDLNRFKEVNDTYGHQLGDQLLIELAGRMQRELRPHDLVSRLGGDEFVLLCSNLQDPQEALLIARRLIAAVSQPWHLEELMPGLILRPAISVGIALCRGHCTGEQLIREADLAMYEAKARADHEPVIFDQSLRDRLLRRQRIRGSLNRVLADRDLDLHLQPVVRLCDGQVVAVEALCRPVDETGEPIAPHQFIQEAEASGLMAPLGVLVLERCFAGVERLAMQLHGLRLAVNFSGQQLANPGMVDDLIRLAGHHHLPPGSVSIEVTEAALLDQSNRCRGQLDRLRQAGFSLILDDFGIGTSSLNTLVDLPIDGLKIHQSYIASMEADPQRRRLIGLILALAADLGLQVVAEGVESCQQRAVLMELGCELAQGYLFGLPVPIQELTLPPDRKQPFCC